MSRLQPVRIALATSSAHPRLSEDDRLLQGALEARGVRAEAAVWDDRGVPWTGFDAVVVRSCWDYHLRPGVFDDWIGSLERQRVPLWNPPGVLRWNSRKTYLRDLAAAGIPTVPTRFVEDGRVPLDSVLDESGWDEVVVKPVVSASAHETWRATRATLAADGARYRRLVSTGAIMVQPFVAGIQTDGEWSLCFFDGSYSHAVLKRPRPGDFRVQADHGGVYAAAEPDPAVVAQAAAALAAAPGGTVYARVDGFLEQGEFRLMELELLEPGMYLASAGAAAGRFADALIRAVDQE